MKKVNEIVSVKLVNIKPYWRNPRNNAKTVEILKKSITDYGFNIPIVLDAKNTIIAGHARYKAVLELGWEEVPCVILDLTEKQAKEYRIADNKSHEATIWQDKDLIAEMKELDSDIMAIYFPDIDLKGMILKDINISGGFGVTGEGVEKAGKEMENRFKDIEKADQERKLAVICPECLNEFYINSSDL